MAKKINKMFVLCGLSPKKRGVDVVKRGVERAFLAEYSVF